MLYVDPKSQAYHASGLEASVRGDYETAHNFLNLASDVLKQDCPSVDASVQRARIMRDSGFTCIREAIDAQDEVLLENAQHTLLASRDITAPLVSGVAPEVILAGSAATPKSDRREIFAEHGATIGLLGRLATVSAVTAGVDTRGSGKEAVKNREEDQAPYGLAHDLLRIGNNGYYRVSNAMVGARQERLNGRLPNMLVWLGRAAYGLAWTAANDRQNLRAAARTAAGRMPHLTSYQKARTSVIVKP